MPLRSIFCGTFNTSIPRLIAVLAILWASPGFAVTAKVRDGGTVQLGSVTYRLDGIDAPELDQICIDEHADAWACGIEARDQLTKLIGGRAVRVRGPRARRNPTFRKPAHRRLLC